MRHKKIEEVFTIIWKGHQQVGFKVESMDKYLFLSPKQIKQCTNIDVTEVEILIGSTIRPLYYKIGEKMFNGEICQNETQIKDFWIECSDSIENMKSINADKLKDFKSIKKIFSFVRNEREVVGIDIGDEKPIFVAANRIKNLTKIDLSEIHILQGSYISPEFYNVGENVYEGKNHQPEICRKSGTILKELNLRLYGKVEEMHERFENFIPPYSSRIYKTFDEKGYNSNNWLADAAGSDDDEVMGDAYWNMD